MPGYDRTDTLPRALFSALPVPALIHDRETIVDANDLTIQWLEAPERGDLVGRPVTDFVHPDGHRAGDERRSLLFERGQEFCDLPLKLCTWNKKDLHVTGGGVRFQAGDRHLALAVAAPDGVRFRIDANKVPDEPHDDVRTAALDALPLPVLAVSDRTVVYANSAACSLLDYLPRDLLGMPALDVLHSEARQAMEERVHLLLELQGRAIALPLKAITRNETHLRLKSLALGLRYENRNVFVFVVTETS